jgi:hypothetical protein
MKESEVIEQEVNTGDKLVDPIIFQPVKSPGNYEAEFAIKGDDLIFHFWPSGYHDAQDKGFTTPHFKRDFSYHLVKVMSDSFSANRIEVENDEDMGAIFVKASGYASNQFYKDMAIMACEKLHKALSDS